MLFIREIKNKYSFVSCNIHSDRKLDAETTYHNKLPDGRKIRNSNEKFETPKILSNSYLLMNESPGDHEILFILLM